MCLLPRLPQLQPRGAVPQYFGHSLLARGSKWRAVYPRSQPSRLLKSITGWESATVAAVAVGFDGASDGGGDPHDCDRHGCDTARLQASRVAAPPEAAGALLCSEIGVPGVQMPGM